MPVRLRIVVLSLLAVSLLGGAWLLFRPAPAEAGLASDFAEASLTDLTKYVQGPAALSLRLMALDAIRRRTDSGVDDALVAIAGSTDLRVAIISTTALGKRRSKSTLKDLVTDGKLAKEVRMAAMTAVAVQWKDPDDLSWLASKAGSDSTLSGHAKWLETHVFGH
jgi:hypothetical protein